MAIDKSKLPPPRKMPLDPAVEAAMTGDPDDPIYGSLDRRRRARNMTDYQRRRAERDARRVKGTYDLPPSIKVAVDALAKHLEAPPSHVAALLLHHALLAVNEGLICLEDYKVSSNSPRYPNSLCWETGDDGAP